MNLLEQLNNSKGGKKSWTYEEERTFVQMRLEGKTSSEISETLGRSAAGFYAKITQIKKLIKENGCQTFEEIDEVLKRKHGVRDEVQQVS